MLATLLNGVQLACRGALMRIDAAPLPPACRLDGMRLTEFRQLVDDEFGSDRAGWIIQSQVLSAEGETAAEMIENGSDPKEAWERLCNAFDVPEERRLGVDRPGK